MFRVPHLLVLLVPAALLAGALGFQHLGGLPPCEMCMWQRWPLLAAIAFGLAAFTGGTRVFLALAGLPWSWRELRRDRGGAPRSTPDRPVVLPVVAAEVPTAELCLGAGFRRRVRVGRATLATATSVAGERQRRDARSARDDER